MNDTQHDNPRYVIPENVGSPDREIRFLLDLHERGDLTQQQLVVYAQGYIQQFGGIEDEALGERLVERMTAQEPVQPTDSGEAS